VAGWTFLSNHAHVLSCLDLDPTIRLRDVADAVGITERATQSIVADLVRSGYVTRTRVGRRNRYVIHRDEPLRHVRHRTLTVGGLLDYLRDAPPPAAVPLVALQRSANTA
jgi:hypothetical protein